MAISGRSALAAAYLAVLAPAVCQATSAPENDSYPVWWSPELGLENLDKIDEALAARFPWRQQFHLYKYDFQTQFLDQLDDEHHPERGYKVVYRDTNLRDRLVVDCVSLMKWIDQGYDEEGTPGADVLALRQSYCYALRALKAATQARTSYLRDFVLDENARENLPAMVGRGWGCRELNQVLEANRNGVPWSHFEYDWDEEDTSTYHLFVISETKLVEKRRVPELGNEVYSQKWIIIYGRGDFNGDGYDDLLLYSEDQFNLNHPGESELYVVSRLEPGAVLRVVGTIGPTASETRHLCQPDPSNFIFDSRARD